MLYVFGHVVLDPKEFCGIALGPDCGKSYDPYHQKWNVTLPNTPKPPVQPIIPTVNCSNSECLPPSNKTVHVHFRLVLVYTEFSIYQMFTWTACTLQDSAMTVVNHFVADLRMKKAMQPHQQVTGVTTSVTFQFGCWKTYYNILLVKVMRYTADITVDIIEQLFSLCLYAHVCAV